MGFSRPMGLLLEGLLLEGLLLEGLLLDGLLLDDLPLDGLLLEEGVVVLEAYLIVSSIAGSG